MSSRTKFHYPFLGWFMLVNIGIFLQASLSLSLLGLDEHLLAQGVSLVKFSLGFVVVGAVGAMLMLLVSRPFICLFLKARMADEGMGTKVQQLFLILEKQARQAGLPTPGLAIYQSDESNAFAVGRGRHRAMLVVSQHLLDNLTLDELSAVVGHELTHIANGDMVTLSLIQGVVNMCVHFPAHVLGAGLDRILSPDRQHAPLTRAITLLLQLTLGGLASLLVMRFSRHREFSADAGGAQLAGYAEMMAALRSLQSTTQHEPAPLPFAVFGLNGHFMATGIMRLFTSHPSIQERIHFLTKNR